MKISRRGLVIALLVVIAASLSGYTAQFLISNRVSPFERALAGIALCAQQKEAVACSRVFVRKVLDMKSGLDVVDAVAATVSPLQCHYVVHVVGQELFAREQSVEGAISQCNRICDSACVHGAIGAAFSDALSVSSSTAGSDLDLDHLTEEEMRKIGRELCTSADNCHGVGHAVFQTVAELGRSMSTCAGIVQEPMSSFCYTGAAMEYADILSSRNMTPVPGVSTPSLDELDTFCDQPLLTQRRACFRYFPRVVIETLTKEGLTKAQAYKRVPEICESYTDDQNRIGCYIGIGAYNTYLILTDKPAAVRACSEFSNEQDQAACFLGEITVAVEDRQNLLIPYCGILPTERLRGACYQQVFFFINRTGGSMENADKLCPAGSNVCLEGLKNYKQDSWELVRTNFKH